MRPDFPIVPSLDPVRSGSLQRGHTFYRSVTFLTVFAMLFGGILLLTAPVSARSGEGWTDEPAPSDEGWSEQPGGNGGESTWTDGGATLYVIGGNLNLRATPSVDGEIVSVLADGTAVTTTGEMSGGFYGVTANGMGGYAFGEFLADAPTSGDSSTDVPSEDVPTDDVTATEPATDESGSAGSVPVGESVTGYAAVFDGPLNLRTGPGMGYAIVTTMPTAASLELRGSVQDGWYPVSYQGTTGWASAEFIGTEGTPTDPGTDEGVDDDAGSVPVPGTEATGYATVFDGGLNLRSGPGLTYAVLTVMPNGSEVAILGDGQNGFLPVSYSGTTGWAYADYLSTGTTPDDGDSDGDTGADPTQPAETPDATEAPSTGDGYDLNGDGQWSRDELVAIITDAANAYGQPVDDMIRVAACESVWDPYSVNSSSGASGLFQFMPGTWLTTPYADQDIFDPVANANAAAWMWSVGRRNEWTCQ